MQYKVRWGWLSVMVAILLVGCGETSNAQDKQKSDEVIATMAVDTPVAPAEVVLREEEKVFEADIQGFEEMEMASPTPEGGILFTGSSSVRLWKTLAEDMAPLPVTNRGFGGSTLRQVHHYADRIILPLQPRLIVLYCGENDIANDTYPAEDAYQDFRDFMAYLEYNLPGTPLIYLSMKPSIARWQYWPKFVEANEKIRQDCEAHPQLTFVDVSEVMLGDNDEPDPGIFIRDNLHMNEIGYARWTELVRPLVEAQYQP